MSKHTSTCIEVAKELESELLRADSAISLNSLSQFEESIWRQQVLCASLQQELAAASDERLQADDRSSIIKALISLQSASHTYDALIQQSRSSTGSVLRLCSRYLDQNDSFSRSGATLCALEA